MAEPIVFDKARLAWTLRWDADWVCAVTFLGPTRKLAAANNLGQILLWDLPEKAGEAPLPYRRLDGHTNVVSRLLTTSDGRWLISSSYDHTIRVWDMQAEAAPGETIVLNAREREQVAKRKGKVPGAIEAKVATQKAARVLEGHRDWITAMALSRDGKLLVSGDDEGQVVVWDFTTGKETNRWRVKGWVQALALSPDQKQVVASERIPLVFDSGRHAGVKLWDRSTGTLQHDLAKQFKGMFLSAAAYAPDGKVLALGRGGEVDGMNGVVYLVDPASGKLLKTLSPGHEHGITDLAFHPDGKHLASTGRDTVVRIWNTTDGKAVTVLGKPRGGQFKDWTHAVAFSADGRTLAAADIAGAVQVWSLTP